MVVGVVKFNKNRTHAILLVWLGEGVGGGVEEGLALSLPKLLNQNKPIIII